MNNTGRSLREFIVKACVDATERVDVFAEGGAAEFSQQLIDMVIATLRRDQHWHSIPRLELELLLADAKHWIEIDLHERVGRPMPLRDTIRAIADELSGKPS